MLERSYDYATMRDIPEQFVICNRTGSPLYLKYLYTGQFIKIWARYSHWGAWLSTSKRSTGKWGKYFAILNRNNSQQYIDIDKQVKIYNTILNRIRLVR